MEAHLKKTQELDHKDPLKSYKPLFCQPHKAHPNPTYLCGNSLGLMPKNVRESLDTELEDWANYGVEGHTQARNPWMYYHHALKKPLSKLVGSLPEEVTPMNGLTANLHLLLASFYQPQGKRNKILIEADAFPSDIYAIESQIRWHGLKPEACLVKQKPRQGEKLLRSQDILQSMDALGDELALVLIGGVNYYTGQFFELPLLARKAHEVGGLFGTDLAHAIGNVPLFLHDWGVDFAAWCSYKYLNSGPGGVSGIFVHNKHGQDTATFRLAGWWGHDEKTRFQMDDDFVPMKGADGWQMSNAPVLSMAAHKAALEHFQSAGMEALREKSVKLTAFCEELLLKEVRPALQQSIYQDLSIITPEDPNQRGCQLSIVIKANGKGFFDHISQQGVIADWREPDVLRIAPVPLYNSFEEVARFCQICIEEAQQQKV